MLGVHDIFAISCTVNILLLLLVHLIYYNTILLLLHVHLIYYNAILLLLHVHLVYYYIK